MRAQAKIQKWGNSSAIRLPATILAAAGIPQGTDVEIQSGNGRLVIQLPERTQEQLFDKLLAEVPDAEKVLSLVSKSLKNAIEVTDKTTTDVNHLCKKLENS